MTSFKKWFAENRDDLIYAPNTETVSELTWRACMEQTRQACFEAVCNQCAEGKGTGCNVCFLKSAIMQAEVE